MKFWKFRKLKKSRKADLEEMEFVLDCVRAKMYDEAFRLEEKRQKEGGVFGAE